MEQRVYIETTSPSYLVARPSRDLIRAAHQELTREWWESCRQGFDLFVSQFVLDEAGDGDPNMAAQRLALLTDVPLLPVTDEAIRLAEGLVQDGPLPEKAATDALHIAMAAVHQMDILLTWNCRHLANARLLGALRRAAESKGHELSVICTPEELMGDPGEE